MSDSKDSDASSDEATGVVLGFAEKCPDDRFLLRSFFPSKIGGKPAWLNPRDLPCSRSGSSDDDLKCEQCNKALHFLLQLSAPINKFESCYHRMLYIFICRSPSCCGQPGSLKVFRSQLPKKNPFYSSSSLAPNGSETDANASDAPNESEEALLARLKPYVATGVEPWQGVSNCFVCGCLGPFMCSSCKDPNIRYCSRDHQIVHWHHGHKKTCKKKIESKQKKQGKQASQNASKAEKEALKSFLFPVFEIVAESEPLATDGDKDDLNDTNKEYLDLMRKYNKNREKREKKAKQKKMNAKDEINKKCKDDEKKCKDIELNEEDAINGTESENESESESESGSDAELTERHLKLLEGALGKQKFDEKFLQFQERIWRHQEQILRYAQANNPNEKDLDAQQGANANESEWMEPLWMATEGILQKDSIPKCEMCGGERKFEFQVLSQLLHTLNQGLNGLDWGTLIVYTCATSCGDGVNGYFKEFIHFQKSPADCILDMQKLKANLEAKRKAYMQMVKKKRK